MSVRHDSMMCFTSWGRQCRSEGSIRCCGPRGRKPHTQRGLRDGYQVRPDPVTRAECIKVSRGGGNSGTYHDIYIDRTTLIFNENVHYIIIIKDYVGGL